MRITLQHYVLDLKINEKKNSIVVHHYQCGLYLNGKRTEYVTPGQSFNEALFNLFQDFMNGFLGWKERHNSKFYRATLLAGEYLFNNTWYIRSIDFCCTDFKEKVHRILFENLVLTDENEWPQLNSKIDSLLKQVNQEAKKMVTKYERQLKKENKHAKTV